MASFSAEQDTTGVRLSGRVRRKPQSIYDTNEGSTSEKRRLQDDEDDEEDSDESSEDGEPDEEELREIRAKQRRQKASTNRAPPQKRVKTNGTTDLAFRTVKRKAGTKATGVSSLDAESAGGIFAEVFAHNADAEAIVSQWLSRFEQHEASALAEIVNFVLRAAGCTSTVTEEHVEDPDNITSVITDLQDEFQATDPTDYPLSKKGRTASTVKQGVAGLLEALVRSIAQTGALFDAPILMENIQVWFVTMSTAANRPFRHTATVVSLVTMTALAQVAQDVANDATKSRQQADTEAKKSTKNKARVQDIEKKAQQAAERQEAVEATLNDWFNTVFVHRYKDIDPAIRQECAAALGQWITILPHIFLGGEHLRYLGWMLSDLNHAVRTEAVKQLVRLYKDPSMTSGLRSFSEKFRVRVVEMATSDADTSVRALAIELLNQLRDNEWLMLDDIDTIGRLIFDADVRVRKATAAFLAGGMEDVCAQKIEKELGGRETLLSTLPDPQDDYGTPRIEWLKLKCVAETLQAYDTESTLPDHVQRSREHGGLVLHIGPNGSRFALAADALYDRVPEIQLWRVVAGYLLFDTSTTRKKRTSQDASTVLKQACKLENGEERSLLDVLCASVKRSITDAVERLNASKPKLSAQQKAGLRDEIEESARDLLIIIQKLFERYGDDSESASIVLRIQQVMVDIPTDLAQDPRAYEVLLEKDKRQFLSHVSNDIPETAAHAILQAKERGNEDAVADMIAGLYDGLVQSLVQSLDGEDVETRGSASLDLLADINDTVRRLVDLAKISDPSGAVDNSSAVSTANGDSSVQAPIDLIIGLVARAQQSTHRDASTASERLEDELAQRAGEFGLFYFRWKYRMIKQRVEGPHSSDIPYDELEALAGRHDKYARTLTSILHNRRPRDIIYTQVAELCIDIHIASTTLESVKRGPNVSDDYTVFIMDLDDDVQKNIMKAFAGAEAAYVSLANKRLAAQDNEEVTRFDDDPVSDSEDESTSISKPGKLKSEERLVATLFAEQRLCVLTREIILAVLAGLMDRRTTRARVERNKNVLGHTFKAVCEFFDHGKPTKKQSTSKNAAKRAVNGDTGKKSRKSHALVAESEEDDEIEDAVYPSGNGVEI